MKTVKFPSLESTGKIFPLLDGTIPRDLRGVPVEIDAWCDAERWSNGTIFALFPNGHGDGVVRMIPSTVDYVPKTIYRK